MDLNPQDLPDGDALNVSFSSVKDRIYEIEFDQELYERLREGDPTGIVSHQFEQPGKVYIATRNKKIGVILEVLDSHTVNGVHYVIVQRKLDYIQVSDEIFSTIKQADLFTMCTLRAAARSIRELSVRPGSVIYVSGPSDLTTVVACYVHGFGVSTAGGTPAIDMFLETFVHVGAMASTDS